MSTTFLKLNSPQKSIPHYMWRNHILTEIFQMKEKCHVRFRREPPHAYIACVNNKPVYTVNPPLILFVNKD